MKVAFVSPLPPARTGVAHYASMVLPALREKLDVDAFDAAAMDHYRAADYDAAIYQLGNNPQHEFVFVEAMRNPGIAVLHDIVLHHLIVEMTLARGDEEAYVAAMRANHGQMGAAWARGRAIGLHDELANFLMPASVELANRSRAVIVHNRYAAERLRDLGVTTPLFVVPHPYVHQPKAQDRDAVRKRLGFAPADRVIGFFGFLTAAKRAEIVLEAFRMARHADAHLKLLIVGEPAPNIDVQQIRGEGITVTGYVGDEEFGSYYAAADRLVNLRYPSAGESSGTLIRALDAGKPVAVSDYAQFAEYPDDCVVRIPFGAQEASRLAEFFLRDIDDIAVATAQRKWLEANASLDLTVKGYLDAIEAARSALECGGLPPLSYPATEKRRQAVALQSAGAPVALFPDLTITNVVRNDDELTITLRNDGDQTIRAADYGQPAYRAVLKIFEGDRELQDCWVALTRDLRPGEVTAVSLSLRVPTTENRQPVTLRLYHGLESIPIVGETAAAEVEIPLVR